MKRKPFFMKAILITVAFMLVIITSCKKDEHDLIESNNLSIDINELVPQWIIDEMESLGMPINGGGSPPSIENAYLATPFILLASNRSGDIIGQQFADYKARFRNQNNEALTVVFDYKNGPEAGDGLGAFIVGTDNKFSVFAELTATAQGQTATLVKVVSGRIVSGGIEDFHAALFMIDNYGNPGGYWIDNGDGRVFHDSDGFSPIITDFKSTPAISVNKSGASLIVE